MTKFDIYRTKIKGIEYKFSQNFYPEYGCKKHGDTCYLVYFAKAVKYPNTAIGVFKTKEEAIKFLKSKTWQDILKSDAHSYLDYDSSEFTNIW